MTSIFPTDFLRIKPVFLLFFLSLSVAVKSQQQPLSVSEEEGNKVFQKLYIHTDRSIYFSGEKIWLKGYILNEFLPDTISTSLYTELLDKDLNLVSRNVFPIFTGVSYGQINIPADKESGNYILRAYTTQHINSPDNHFLQKLWIYGSKKPAGNQNAVVEKTIKLGFYPEGGNLVNGLVNNIAFKATDQYGLPVNFKGVVVDGQSDTLAEVETYHQGMGKFSLRPLSGQQYFLIMEGDNLKFSLPAAVDEGINIMMNRSEKGIVFKVEQDPKTSGIKRAGYITGSMQGQTVFKKELNENLNSFSGVLPTASLPSGIIKFTVFNSSNIPLAERLVFINNEDYKVSASLLNTSFNPFAHHLNQFKVKFSEAVVGSFSVSVTDADFDNHLQRPENILTQFLLSGELNGYIHEPSYYFTSTADSIRQALDLVMLTNGWRRFNWMKDQLGFQNPSSFISLKGSIINEYNKKPFANEVFFMMMKPETDTSKKRGEIRMINTDSAGMFQLDSLIFPGRMALAFYKYPADKGKKLKVIFDSDSLHAFRKSTELPLWFQYLSPMTDTGMREEMYAGHIFENAKMLEEVVVSARVKTEREKLDDIYATGYFKGGASAKTLDVRSETSTENIFDYIRSRIPGVSVERDTGAESMGNYVVKLRQLNSEHWPNPPLQIYLNEMPASPEFIEAIPVNEIAYVKVFPTFIGNAGGLGALAIYTKNFNEIFPETSLGYSTNYNGYTIVEEFYQPDYTVKPYAENKSDNRLTLLWKPDILLADINPELPIEFYNNSRTKRFRIVVEGITREGKLVMIEKIIE